MKQPNRKTSEILEATGASVRPGQLFQEKQFYIADFGASPDASPLQNTEAFQTAIKEAALSGGGTVVVPAGHYLVYTILLKSNVNLYLEEGAVVAAARTDIVHSYEKQTGEGGNYAEPEVNPYLGLQDHGHSYFANSLLYGADLENIMIYGKGLFTGGRFSEDSSLLEYVLQGGDPEEPADRLSPGHKGEWFGNKGLALVRCKNIVLKDFSFTIGGHFAIITEGCENLYVDNVLVDTTRDAFDIDCCKNVTVLNTTCNSLTDVIFEDCTLDNVSSSPIFIRAGERARFPVTGVTKDSAFPSRGDVRLDNPNWVLPNTSRYLCYPARRYSPHYNRTKTVTVDGCSFFEIVDAEKPVLCNPVNYTEKDGHFYAKVWDEAEHAYVTDFSRELPEKNLPLYANAIGCEEMATVANVCIRNVKITNADPRYPILLMGLTDSHLKNITLENIQVEYRGGLTMEHAVEQRQLNTEWKFSQFHAKEHVQNLPWLVNTFFLKNEGLLPRADWNPDLKTWQDDPYNVPELPDVYPEPSNWGILPSYGIFAKHVDGLTLRNIEISTKVPDSRHVCVLDDMKDVVIDGLTADCTGGTAPIALITDSFRRHTNAENVPEQPYFTTRVEGLDIQKPIVLRRRSAEAGIPTAASPMSPADSIEECFSGEPLSVEINAPAPGTPSDSLYPYPTVPCSESGYHFAVATDDYPLPLTVYRPFLRPVPPVKIPAGQEYRLQLTLRNPATDISTEADNGMIYNEQQARLNHSVKGADVTVSLSCENLPEGAAFTGEGCFIWTPSPAKKGSYEITFVADDGVIPEKMTVKLEVI